MIHNLGNSGTIMQKEEMKRQHHPRGQFNVRSADKPASTFLPFPTNNANSIILSINPLILAEFVPENCQMRKPRRISPLSIGGVPKVQNCPLQSNLPGKMKEFKISLYLCVRPFLLHVTTMAFQPVDLHHPAGKKDTENGHNASCSPDYQQLFV